MRYMTDGKRHLVCLPYSEENLHDMAKELEIARCWFHSSPYPHYDIPLRRKKEIEGRCNIVSPKDIIRICKGEIK
jgi:hypothetical protein